MQTYNKTCLNPVATCYERERLAALMDYVNAVYFNEDGKGLYNGVFTDLEKQSLEKQFKLLTDWAKRNEYLSEARQKFFERHSSSKKNYVAQCGDKTFHSRLDGNAPYIAGSHECGSRFGNLYAPLELSVATAPESWAFAIEGGCDTWQNNREEEEVEESALFCQMAETLAIPTFDPIPFFSDTTLINEAIRLSNNSYSKTGFAVAVVWKVIEQSADLNNIAVMDIVASYKQQWGRTPLVQPGLHIEEAIQITAQEFGLTASELKGSFAMQFPRDPLSVQKIDAKLNEANQKWDLLIQASNSISRQNIAAKAREYSSTERNRIFYAIGLEHEAIPLSFSK